MVSTDGPFLELHAMGEDNRKEVVIAIQHFEKGAGGKEIIE